MQKPKFIIIDGNALLHRSFHALPPLTTKNGEMINAVYGFTMVMLKVLREIHPKYIAVTFDKAEPTFRHEMYEEYKGTRVKAEGIEELYNQIPKLKEVLEAFHIPVYEKSGYEADDVIGTIAHKLSVGNDMQKNEKVEILIVTGDLDTLQLINEHTKIYTLKKGLSDVVIYDEAGVKERFEGLTPDQMIDYKALRGDPSDNIPGVHGIGEKGAIKLLTKFRTVENLYEKLLSHEDFLPAKLAEKLLTHKDEAFLSKKLATIITNAPINFKFNECEWPGYEKQRIFDLFQEFEFRSLLNRLPEKIYDGGRKDEEEISTAAQLSGNYILINTDEKFEKFYSEISKQTQITITTIVSSENPFEGGLLGISFSWEEGEGYYMPVIPIKQREITRHSEPERQEGEESRGLQHDHIHTSRPGIIHSFVVQNDALKSLLENPVIKKCGHNIKFDMLVLKKCGIQLKGINFDTMIASYLLNPGSRAHELEDLSFREFGHQMMPFEEIIGKGKTQINIEDADINKISFYSCERADYILQLMKKLYAKLAQYKSEKVFNEIEMPLVPVLADMEFAGIKIDISFLNNLSKRLTKGIGEIEEKIYKMAGCEFNISSPSQLKDILFDKLKIPVKNIRKGKTGLSTAAPELLKMRGIHPIIDLISDHRELAKLISTYVDALPKLVNEKTGRIHTTFNQTVTATGRLSSSNPNLQNIPIKTELGKSIRKAFIADKGYKLISADYSQVELRIVASLANDEKMIAAFREGIDIHTATASEIFKVPKEEATSAMRRKAKAINFGIMYGMGPRGLSEGADITFEEAETFIDEYFLLYKNVKKFIDRSLEKARDLGYAETFFGRRRYLPEIASGSPFIRAAAERMALNHPIQGTSADLIKLAMIKLHNIISEKYSDKIKMLLQIHDELLFEVKEDFIGEASEIIRDGMETAAKFSAPIKVDIEVGDNWGEI
ncbi:MAG: DNA polymerase I [bacterium]